VSGRKGGNGPGRPSLRIVRPDSHRVITPWHQRGATEGEAVSALGMRLDVSCDRVHGIGL
jgi:hypothetical protein